MAADLVACTATGQIYEIGVQKQAINLANNESCGNKNLVEKSSRKKREVLLSFEFSHSMLCIADNRYPDHQFIFFLFFLFIFLLIGMSCNKFIICVALKLLHNHS